MTTAEGEAPRDLALALLFETQLADGVPSAESTAELLTRLCRILVSSLGMTGAALRLTPFARLEGAAVVASDERARVLEELQFANDRSPALDALTRRRPVLTPDLRFSADQKWPHYSSAALAAGVVAVYAFPLFVGGAGLGVLDVYSDRPGSLDQHQEGMALAFAQIAIEIVMDGRLHAENSAIAVGLDTANDFRGEIPQAQGMLTVALGVNLAEALVRMRAYAFTSGLSLLDISHGVVAESLDLADFASEWGTLP